MNYKQYNLYETYASRNLHLSYNYIIAQPYLVECSHARPQTQVPYIILEYIGVCMPLTINNFISMSTIIAQL
jgi:hypothetical protein